MPERRDEIMDLGICAINLLAKDLVVEENPYGMISAAITIMYCLLRLGSAFSGDTFCLIKAKINMFCMNQSKGEENPLLSILLKRLDVLLKFIGSSEMRDGVKENTCTSLFDDDDRKLKYIEEKSEMIIRELLKYAHTKGSSPPSSLC